jgi:Rrf2 family protein
MHLTAKSRYALQILLELARSESLQKKQRAEISLRHNIPLVFMDQILAKLRRSGLIVSKRGPSGGLLLKKSPEEISLWEVFSSVEESLSPVKCIDEFGSCRLEEKCISQEVWLEIYADFKQSLASKTLDRYLEK